MLITESLKSFIHRVEIWDIDPVSGSARCRRRLEDHQLVSLDLPLQQPGDGMIGAVSGLGIPKVFSIQGNPEFVEELQSKNAAAAFAFPIFSDNNTVSSILCFYFQQIPGMKGAVEIWVGEAGRYALKLDEFYYPGLERFGFISQYVHFPIGSGLPGMVWESGNAIMIDELGQSNDFLRSTGAENEGLDFGLAFPCIKGRELLSVNMMLSTIDTPMMRVCEIWHRCPPADVSDEDGDEDEAVGFPFALHSIGGINASFVVGSQCHAPSQLQHSLVGRVVETGDFQLWARTSREPAPIGWENEALNQAVAIPIFSLKQVISIIVLGW